MHKLQSGNSDRKIVAAAPAPQATLKTATAKAVLAQSKALRQMSYVSRGATQK